MLLVFLNESQQSAGRAMREVEVRLKQWKMGDALAKLRNWLDHNGAVPVTFDISRAATGSLLVRIVFKNDREAELFERDFRR